MREVIIPLHDSHALKRENCSMNGTAHDAHPAEMNSSAKLESFVSHAMISNLVSSFTAF